MSKGNMNIVTTHRNTDFDGLASMIAITLIYEKSVAVCPKGVNPNVQRFLSIHKTAFKLILPNEVDHESVEQLIVVDTNRWGSLDRMDKFRAREKITIHLWDHHMHQGDISAHWKCQEKTGATITLIVREIRRRKIPLKTMEATLFLIGLYEDTGHLSFPSTTAEDAYTAGFLIENGADLKIAHVFLNPPYEEVQKDILFQMMQEVEKIHLKDMTVGLTIIRLESHVEMLSTVVHMYRKIINVDAVFVIFVNLEGSLLIIGRSGVEPIDIGSVLQKLGGGGHPGAGSAVIKNPKLSPREVKSEILQLLKETQPVAATVADIMSFPVTTAPPGTTMREVRSIMSEKGVRGILIAENDQLQGIIVLWDFKKLKQERQWNSPVKAFMNRNLTTIAPDSLPSEAAKIMVKDNIGHLPVLQEKRIIGIVTRSDVLSYFYNLLPE